MHSDLTGVNYALNSFRGKIGETEIFTIKIIFIVKKMLQKDYKPLL